MLALRSLAVAVVVGTSALAQPAQEVVADAKPSVSSVNPRVELLLYPVRAQINPVYTNHLGSSGAVQLRLSESFAFMISGGYDWLTSVSPFNDQLVQNFRVEQQAAQSLLWTWSALAGVELSPAFGQVQVGNGAARFGLFVNGGLGAGGSRHQLVPATDVRSTPLYGDTGVRFLGSLGAGLRVQLGTRLTFRLEVRDVAASATVSSVNGCSRADLTALRHRFDLSLGDDATPVSAGCRADSFVEGGRVAGLDPALSLTQSTSQAPLLHTVTAALGASVVF